MRSVGNRWFVLGAILAVALVPTALATAKVESAAKLRGNITADGSSTVGPYTTSAAELFRRANPAVRITVAISGTGGGFQRFCNGEIDLANASRPIKASEIEACQKNNVKWSAFAVANDGITLVVNRQNTWASCLTVAQLKKIWEPSSRVDNWNEIDPTFPNQKLKLFGPGTDSGTFDFFTEKINGKSRASRSDYAATENDNVIVEGVAGEKGGLGYFGLSYYEENQKRLKAIKIDGGQGCVAPSKRAVQLNTYRPLSRPLFIYAKRTSFQRQEVRAFIGYILQNERRIAKRSRFVSLTNAQLKNSREHYRTVLKVVKGG